MMESNMDGVTPEEAQAVIRSCRANGRFAEATRYIYALPQAFRASIPVEIEVIQLYLVQGYYRLAADCCEAVSTAIPKESDASGAQISFEVAAFQLLKAFVWISRYSKLKTSLKIAERIGKELNLCPEQGLILETLVDSDFQRNGQYITQDYNSDDVSRDLGNISEYEILTHLYYWKILVVAAQQGLIDQRTTQGIAVKYISALRRRVQLAGRLREARFLLFFEADMYLDQSQGLHELQAFVELLEDPKWITEKALTLSDIASFQLKSANDAVVQCSPATIKEARCAFAQADHRYGDIDLDLEIISARRDITNSEKFSEKVRIAERYFSIDHLQNGIRCLVYAISPDMNISTQFEGVAKSLELLEHKISLSGSEILKQASLLHAVCQACLKASEYGFALQALESYYAKPPDEIGPRNHSSLALMLSQAYLNFGELGKAVQLSEESLAIAKKGASYQDKSDAAFYVGVIRLNLSRQCVNASKEAIEWNLSAKEILTEWIERDAAAGNADGEFDKCLQLSECESDRISWDSTASDAKEKEDAGQRWIERARKHITDSSPLQKRAALVDFQLRILMRHGKYEESANVAREYLADVLDSEKVAAVHPITKGKAYLDSSIQVHLLAYQMLQSDQSSAGVNLLGTALQLASHALSCYRQTNGSEIIINVTNHVWYQLQQYLRLLQEDVQQSLLRAFMAELLETEKVVDEMRRSVIPVKELQSLMKKRQLVSKDACVKFYHTGAVLSLLLDDAGAAWTWVQKGKARAFVDALGATYSLPQLRLEEINRDPIACELIRKEQWILEQLGDAAANHVLSARRLVEHRAVMASNPLLTELTGLQHGIFNENLGDEFLEKLESMGVAPEMVRFVDWFVPSLVDTHDERIILLVRRIDGTTQRKELRTSIKDVQNWLGEAFRHADLAEPLLSRKSGNNLLKKMNGLVEGLSDMTSKDDTLILSPSGLLNMVPLHALFIDRVPLIQRNLVIYCSSAATLRQCVSRVDPSSSPTAGTIIESVRYFAVYEETSKQQERNAIFSNVKELSTTFPGVVTLGPSVTKPRFLEECSHAKWIHYHGHATYDKTEILQSSLVLSNGNDQFAEPLEDREDDDGIDKLTIRDIFESQSIMSGTHFTIIACDSGTQDMAPGDEPLGIIPALLHAGASSVLGCLWPIDSKCGRAFSSTFYRELARNLTLGESVAGSGNVVHTAQALRSTVIKMIDGELGVTYKQPYYWASFCLHGAWAFRF